MKILDRYILKTYLASLVVVLAALMGIAILLDMAVSANKFLDLKSEMAEAGFWTLVARMADYYFYQAFYYFQLFAALALLVAAAAGMVRLNRTRELTGMKAAGISLYRVLWPIILVGLALDGFYIVNQEILLPRMAVELVRDPDDLNALETFSVEFIRDNENNILYAPIYDPETQEMQAEKKVFEDGRVTFPARVRIFLRDSQYRAMGTIEAERATWDARLGAWRLEGGVRLPPVRQASLLERVPEGPEGEPFPLYYTNVGPEEILRHRTSDFYRYMSYSELKTLARDPMRGNRLQLEVAMHQHITSPILNVLILLLGLPFVAGREDRNYFVGVGLAVALVIGVFILTFAATAFGNAGHVPPIWAAWIPIFLVLPPSILSMEMLKT
ncbi:MAG: LptF/LptG family permease [Planctomycetes bacterium]|nr:LptF/LptG family permease [Planctomycetota bacterium]